MPRTYHVLLLVSCCVVARPHGWHEDLQCSGAVEDAGEAEGSLNLLQTHVNQLEPRWLPWKDLSIPLRDNRYVTWSKLPHLLVPVVLCLTLGSLAAYGMVATLCHGDKEKVVLTMGVFAVFLENLLYSSVFVDSFDFADSVLGDESKSGGIIGVHKMGTATGTLCVMCMFMQFPDLWRSSMTVMCLGFGLQLLGACSFGILCLANEYIQLDGSSYNWCIHSARFVQGAGGGVQVAFGLEQSAMLLTGLERSVHNTRFYLGGCLGMGMGPLLSSFSAGTAQLLGRKSGETSGFDSTFAVCTLLPLIQLPVLLRTPQRLEAGDRNQGYTGGDSPQYSQRILVMLLCIALQAMRSFCSASVEAALSQLLHTQYHWSRRATGVVTAAVMFTMLPAQVVYEQIGLRFSVSRAIRFLLVVSVVGSGLSLLNSVLGLVASACMVLPSLALSSGLIMGTMQAHHIPGSFVFDLNGTTLASLLVSDFVGRGLGPTAARHSIDQGGQQSFGEQQLLVSIVCLLFFELAHACSIADVPGKARQASSVPSTSRL